jgi:hypothetical protein
MIRRSLLAVAFGFLALAGMSRVASAQPKTQNVDANINSALQLDLDGTTVPAPWNLVSGTTNVMSAAAGGGIILTAHANVQYTIRQNCDTGGKAGFDQSLFEFAAPTYAAGGLHINAHLQIRALPAGTLADISTDTTNGTLLSGASAQAPTAAQPFNVELSQLVDFGDQRLTNGNLYHMVITFTIVAGST